MGYVPTIKLGKQPKKVDRRTLQFSKYLAASAIHFPSAFDAGQGVSEWPMYSNDLYGSCTCAAVGHLVEVFSKDAGTLVVPQGQEVLEMYFDVDNGGRSFNPGDPQDRGATLLDVINLWRKKGIAGVRPYAYTEVMPRNSDEVKAAVYLFGGIDIGIQLPLSAEAEVAAGMPWAQTSGAPGTWGGHAVNVVSYDASGIICVTWGQLQRMTWDFFTKYCDEAYAILPSDWENKVVDGYNWQSLQQDLDNLSGATPQPEPPVPPAPVPPGPGPEPVPPPAPGPSPSPTPTPTPTSNIIPFSMTLGVYTVSGWYDPTPGSTVIVLKTKNEAGKEVTGTISLT